MPGCLPRCAAVANGAVAWAHATQVWRARRAGSLQTVAVKLITKHGKNEKDLRNLRQARAGGPAARRGECRGWGSMDQGVECVSFCACILFYWGGVGCV